MGKKKLTWVLGVAHFASLAAKISKGFNGSDNYSL